MPTSNIDVGEEDFLSAPMHLHFEPSPTALAVDELRAYAEANVVEGVPSIADIHRVPYDSRERFKRTLDIDGVPYRVMYAIGETNRMLGHVVAVRDAGDQHPAPKEIIARVLEMIFGNAQRFHPTPGWPAHRIRLDVKCTAVEQLSDAWKITHRGGFVKMREGACRS